MEDLDVNGSQEVKVDFKEYLKRYEKVMDTFYDNHDVDKVRLTSIPTIEAADEQARKCFDDVPSLFFQKECDLTQSPLFEHVILEQRYGTPDVVRMNMQK